MSTRSSAWQGFAFAAALAAGMAIAGAAEPEPIAGREGLCSPDSSTWPWPEQPIVVRTEHGVEGGARVETCLGGLDANGTHIEPDANHVCVVPVGGLVTLRAVVGDPQNPLECRVSVDTLGAGVSISLGPWDNLPRRLPAGPRCGRIGSGATGWSTRKPIAPGGWTTPPPGEDLAPGTVFPLTWLHDGGLGGVALWADIRGERRRVGWGINPWLPGLYDFSVGPDGAVHVTLDPTFAGGSVSCPATTFPEEWIKTLRP